MLKELLRDTFAFIQPAAIVGDLTAEEAARRLELSLTRSAKSWPM